MRAPELIEFLYIARAFCFSHTRTTGVAAACLDGVRRAGTGASRIESLWATEVLQGGPGAAGRHGPSENAHHSRCWLAIAALAHRLSRELFRKGCAGDGHSGSTVPKGPSARAYLVAATHRGGVWTALEAFGKWGSGWDDLTDRF